MPNDPPDPTPVPAAVEAHALSATFGRIAVSILIEKNGAEATVRFIRSVVAATMPGTPERAAQDVAWAALTRRLIAASTGGAD